MVNHAVPVPVARRLSVAANIMSPMELWSMAFLMCISQPVAPVRPRASIARLLIRGTTTDQRHGRAAWPPRDYQLPVHRPGTSLRDTRRCTLRHRHQLGEKRQSLPSGLSKDFVRARLPFWQPPPSAMNITSAHPFEELDVTLNTITDLVRSSPRVYPCQNSDTRKLILVLRTATCSSHMAP